MAVHAQDLTDQRVVDRYRSMLVHLPGSDCLWWKGAISRNAGHGRFWIGRGNVEIAHRFAYALVEGIDALHATELLAHDCDNPLCQRIGPGHVRPSTPARNQLDWQARGQVPAGNYIGPATSYERALVMRNLLRLDPTSAARHLAALPLRYGIQPALW